MYLPLRIALRYVFSKHTSNAINIIAYITIAGIATITFAMFVILSVFNGFEGLIMMLFNTFNPDIKLTAAQGKVIQYTAQELAQLRALPNVIGITYCLEENVLLRNGNKQYIARMKGVDADYTLVSDIKNAMVAGDYMIGNSEGYNTCVIGVGVENTLGLDVNNPTADLDMYLPRRNANEALLQAINAFEMQTIYPVGAFSIQQEFDARYLLVPFALAKSMLNYDTLTYTSVEIKAQHNANIEQLQADIKKIVGTKCRILNRMQQDESIYKIMKLESWLVFALLSLVLFIASFNIISSLSMLIIEKKKDIAILQQLGATPTTIRIVFMLVGVLLAVVGSLIGLLVGGIVCGAQALFGLVKIANSGTFVVDTYPVDMHATDALLVLMLVLVLALIASWLPTRKIIFQKISFNER